MVWTTLGSRKAKEQNRTGWSSDGSSKVRVLSKSVKRFRSCGVEICPSPLTWPLAYTAACTTVQAVIRVCWYVCFVYVVIATKPVHRAPIANPPNNAQSGGTPYHSPKLHPGPCSSVGMPRGTDRQTGHTDGRDHYTFRVVYDSRDM